MKTYKLKKILFALLFISAAHIALGSFTGSSERKSRKLYSLSNFNKNFYKSLSPFSLRSGFEYKGTQLLRQRQETNGDVTFTSMMRYEKGNTTYIYPYVHKVSSPKFKIPVAPSIR